MFRLRIPRLPAPLRAALMFAVIMAISIPLVYWLATPISIAGMPDVADDNTRLNWLMGNSVDWLRQQGKVAVGDTDVFGTIEDLAELRKGKWPGSFNAPELVTYTEDSTGYRNTSREELHPALLMLHVFSMGTETSRLRRQLIRKYHPLLSVPAEYRHLVDVRFILGRNSPDDNDAGIRAEEKAIEEEQNRYGDLVRLEGLHNGENMNQGKTLAWMRWVGREGGREAQWVFKCDDDTLPFVPNLLPYLLKLDPSKPTYMGSFRGVWWGYAYYFQGMIYGFNWGVIKSLASAEIGEFIEHRSYHEDAYTGLLMYNLPAKPDHPTAAYPEMDPHFFDPSNNSPSIPVSPDPRTGLMRLDWDDRAGNYHNIWTASARRALAWHSLKTEEKFVRAYDKAVKGFKAMGREFVWDPPASLQKYARPASDAGDIDG